MSRLQTYLYPYIFISSYVLLSLVNSLQISDPVWIPENETTVDYDPTNWNSGPSLDYDSLPRYLDYGKFDFKATYKGSQIMIIGQIIEYTNGTREFSLRGHYRVVIISNSFGTQGVGKLNIYDEFDIGLCTSTPSSSSGGIGQKVVGTILECNIGLCTSAPSSAFGGISPKTIGTILG